MNLKLPLLIPTLPVLPPGVLEKGELRIDGTGYGRITQCQTLAWYELGHRRVPDYRAPARGFGTALHAARQVQRQGWGHGPYDKRCQQAMEEAIDMEFAGVELEEGEWRTAGRAKELVGLYLQRYPEETFDVLGSEISAEKVLGEVEHVIKREDYAVKRACKVIWQGRTDEVARDRSTGSAVILDLKTAQEAYLDHEVNKYRMSVTLPMYCWLFSGAQFGEINDAVIDLAICRKPLQRPSAKSAPRNEFHRMAFHYSSERIAEVKRDVLKVIAAWLTACGHYAEPPPMTGAPSECHRYKRPCSFLQVCEQATLQQRLAWLHGSAEFKDNEWNPLAPVERKQAAVSAPEPEVPANY